MKKSYNRHEGISYIIKPSFYGFTRTVLDELVNSGLMGFSTADTAQRIVTRWIGNNIASLRQMGIDWQDAKRKGYYPIKPEDNEPLKYWRVHQRNPLRIEIGGCPAYVIDKLKEMNLYGKTREGVVEGMVDDWVIHSVQDLKSLGINLKFPRKK